MSSVRWSAWLGSRGYVDDGCAHERKTWLIPAPEHELTQPWTTKWVAVADLQCNQTHWKQAATTNARTHRTGPPTRVSRKLMMELTNRGCRACQVGGCARECSP